MKQTIARFDIQKRQIPQRRASLSVGKGNEMEFTSLPISDYTHSLNTAGVDPRDVRRCLAVWGISQERRKVGIVVELHYDFFAYILGSCDLSGWGCNDDAFAVYFQTVPSLESLDKPDGTQWIEDPADLNLWISNGSVEPYPWA